MKFLMPFLVIFISASTTYSFSHAASLEVSAESFDRIALDVNGDRVYVCETGERLFLTHWNATHTLSSCGRAPRYYDTVFSTDGETIYMKTRTRESFCPIHASWEMTTKNNWYCKAYVPKTIMVHTHE